MASERSGIAKGLLIGFVAGAVAGAVTALLYAPKSGKELRSDIKQKANEFKDDAEKRFADLRDRSKEEGGSIATAFRAGVDAYKSEKGRARS